MEKWKKKFWLNFESQILMQHKVGDQTLFVNHATFLCHPWGDI
jgi:hypothetical protein